MKWIFIIAVLCLLGCRSIKYVPMKTETIENNSIVKNDSVHTDKETIQKDSSNVTERTEKSDSTIISDSSVIVVNEQGNVIKTEKYRTKEVYRNKDTERIESKYRELESKHKELQQKYDSLFVEKQKTIDVPYPVEKPLSRWQNLKLQVGGFAMSAIVVIILIVVGKIAHKLRK